MSTLLSMITVFSACLLMTVSGHASDHTKRTIRTSEVERILLKYGSILQKGDQVKEKLTPQCSFDIELYINSFDEWALRMEDAEGKPGSGIMDGHNQWIGAYDECRRVAASAEYNDTSSNTLRVRKFNGKYCRSYWFNEYEEIFSLGTCVPESCSENDVAELFYSELIPVFETYCGPDNDFGKDPAAIVASVVLGIFALIILSATVYDIVILPNLTTSTTTKSVVMVSMKSYNNGAFSDDVTNSTTEINTKNLASNDIIDDNIGNGKRSQYDMCNGNGESSTGKAAVEYRQNISTGRKPSALWEKLLLSFSLKSNLPKMLSTAQPKGSYDCVNGIRFLSMLWIILHHTHNLGFIMNSTVTVENQYTYGYILQPLTAMFIINGQVAVETFFVLSGFLVAISFLKTTARQGGKIKLRQMVLFYVHRFVRLTPVYMIVVMIAACYVRYAPGSALRPRVINGAAECRESWWTNLIYLNNFLLDDKPCLGHTWYLANDMQFYVISPLFLIPFALVPISGFVIAGTLFAAHITIFGYMNYKSITDNIEQHSFIYIKPYCRIGPYLIGSVLGYIIYRTKSKVKMNKLVVLIGWLVSFALLFFTIYGLYWNNSCEGCTGWSKEIEITYWTTMRSGFSLALAWIIFACLTGYGGFINSFLSWKLFVPLSRLAFVGYLLHPIFMFYYAYTRNDLVYIQLLPWIYIFIGHATLTIAGAFVISICFEIPFLELDKILLPRK